MKVGEKRTLRIGKQAVTGIFLREVRFLFFWKRYEFLVVVHTRNFDYGTEYDDEKVFKVAKSNIL